jgi:hypothetical protein
MTCHTGNVPDELQMISYDQEIIKTQSDLFGILDAERADRTHTLRSCECANHAANIVIESRSVSDRSW